MNTMRKSNKTNIIYDLEDRTTRFGESIINYVKSINQDVVTRPLIDQLVRSGTSIGANYCEADDAESKKDFRHKIGICKKESRECRYFLRMMRKSVTGKEIEIRELIKEATELNLIFNTIYRKVSE